MQPYAWRRQLWRMAFFYAPFVLVGWLIEHLSLCLLVATVLMGGVLGYLSPDLAQWGAWSMGKASLELTLLLCPNEQLASSTGPIRSAV